MLTGPCAGRTVLRRSTGPAANNMLSSRQCRSCGLTAGKTAIFNLLKPTGHQMHQQFNIQQLYVLPTLYLCVLYLSENKHRLVPLTA